MSRRARFAVAGSPTAVGPAQSGVSNILARGSRGRQAAERTSSIDERAIFIRLLLRGLQWMHKARFGSHSSVYGRI